MKIKISDLETYELKIPEELDFQEVASLTRRLNLILKLADKDIINDKSERKSSRKILFDNKENCIKYINIYNNKSALEANEFLKSLGLRGDYPKQTLYNIKTLAKKKWNL